MLSIVAKIPILNAYWGPGHVSAVNTSISHISTIYQKYTITTHQIYIYTRHLHLSTNIPHVHTEIYPMYIWYSTKTNSCFEKFSDRGRNICIFMLVKKRSLFSFLLEITLKKSLKLHIYLFPDHVYYSIILVLGENYYH